jgi:class 3 adenylate cyclase
LIFPRVIRIVAAMRLRDGTIGQKLLFALLVAFFAIGLVLSFADEVERIGTPNVGWVIDNGYVSPTRIEASRAGLRGGGRAVMVNGQPVERELSRRGPGRAANLELGASNTLIFQTPARNTREVTLTVRPWQWGDVVFTKGAVDTIGVLFFVVAVVSFIFRPYQTSSWALLTLASLSAGALITTYTAIGDRGHVITTIFFYFMICGVYYAPLHTALAFPVVHPFLTRRPRILWLIYGVAVVHAVINVVAWRDGFPGMFSHLRGFGSTLLLITISLFIARCGQLAFASGDQLIRQRARILLGGAILGIGPFVISQFLQQALGVLAIDNRFTLWPLGVFVIALGRITVRQELLNARIAVRRAVLYGAAVAVLTAIIFVVTAVEPMAVPILLFPVLYLWPRFDARLDRRLYPQRARFPEILRTIGTEMAVRTTPDAVLDDLAHVPQRLCDARTCVAFLLADDDDAREHVRAVGMPIPSGPPLREELVVQLARTMRTEIKREQLAIEPQYANIRAECAAGLDRLNAEVLIPLVHQQRSIGGLAVGARASGDPYEAAEIDAFHSAVQQAVQAIVRVHATERLRAREHEFADLKRFFPPQIIDQVMARGGAAELRSQRKPVTVVFADLRGFTAFSDSVEPEEVMQTLSEYHSVVGRRIAEFSGTLEHFEGDGFMVFFNDPVEQPDHAERAVGLALAMRADVERLREGWKRKGSELHIGIGINSGFATCGFIGYEGRRDYAVIGNVTNLAARLCDKAAAGEILISTRVQAELGDRYHFEPAGELTLKGFHQAQTAYRLVGLNGGG